MSFPGSPWRPPPQLNKSRQTTVWVITGNTEWLRRSARQGHDSLSRIWKWTRECECRDVGLSTWDSVTLPKHCLGRIFATRDVRHDLQSSAVTEQRTDCGSKHSESARPSIWREAIVTRLSLSGRIKHCTRPSVRPYIRLSVRPSSASDFLKTRKP